MSRVSTSSSSSTQLTEDEKKFISIATRSLQQTRRKTESKGRV